MIRSVIAVTIILSSVAWFEAALSQDTLRVEIYDLFEISVTNDQVYSNPFDFEEITLRSTYLPPSGDPIAFYGFYDGDGNGAQEGNVWKIRFMPDQLGFWDVDYSWSDGTPGDSFTLEVIPSENKGFLQVDPENPHHMIYANGDRFLWMGDAEWFFLSDEFTQQDRFDAIEFLAEYRVNNFLMTMVNDRDHDVFPWAGPRESLDQSRFNLARLKAWDEVVARMGELGVVADLWFYSDDSYELYPPEGGAIEDLYFRTIIARFAAYSNVTWNLALEYQEYRTVQWVRDRASFVRANDPWQRLLAVHQLPGTYDFPGNEDLDHTSLQQWVTPDELHQNVLMDRETTTQAGRPIPIMVEEFIIEGLAGNFGDFERFRHGIWTITTAGGYFKTGTLGWTVGTPYEEAEHFELIRHLFDFYTQLPYWEMVPSDDLVDVGYGLAKPGEEYVVYLPEGGTVTVDLTDAPGSFLMNWFDPLTGQILEEGPVTGGAPLIAEAPNDSSWVLQIGQSLHPASVESTPSWSPNPPIRIDRLAPNPMGADATLRFSLRNPARVTLRIFDLQGRRTTVPNQYLSLPAGTHEVTVAGTDLRTGIYFSQLSAGRFSATQKLYVVR